MHSLIEKVQMEELASDNKRLSAQSDRVDAN
jgi:hypothetical protein